MTMESKTMREWATQLGNEGNKAASVACLRAAQEIDRLRDEAARLNERLAGKGDPRAIIENARNIRARRLADILAAVEDGRCRWGRLKVVRYNDFSGKAFVVDDTEKGDGHTRDY